EPGIGKTRTLEELAERARTAGALVLWGRCYEGAAARPWGPFAEGLGGFIRTATEETLRGVLGPEAAPLSKLVPAVRARMPELPEPGALEPYEERVRPTRAQGRGGRRRWHSSPTRSACARPARRPSAPAPRSRTTCAR